MSVGRRNDKSDGNSANAKESGAVNVAIVTGTEAATAAAITTIITIDIAIGIMIAIGTAIAAVTVTDREIGLVLGIGRGIATGVNPPTQTYVQRRPRNS